MSSELFQRIVGSADGYETSKIVRESAPAYQKVSVSDAISINGVKRPAPLKKPLIPEYREGRLVGWNTLD